MPLSEAAKPKRLAPTVWSGDQTQTTVRRGLPTEPPCADGLNSYFEAQLPPPVTLNRKIRIDDPLVPG